jgi:UDP-2-acetamido-3-amino-2,3-dideoxy-glucuronate N-acetyltransferase
MSRRMCIGENLDMSDCLAGSPAKTVLVHRQAVVEQGAVIGEGTRVWAFAHILKGAIIGAECNICDHTFIEEGVRMGNRVTLKCGVALWKGMLLEDDVFIGPDAVFTNDKRPRSRKYPGEFLKTLLKEGCSIGANSTVLPDLTIGRWAMVGAGAVVTRSVPDYGLVYGNPARLKGWVCRCGARLVPTVNADLACACGVTYRRIGPNEVQEVGAETAD